MKFQNPSMRASKGMRGLKSVTYGRTKGRTDGQAQSNIPSQLSLREIFPTDAGQLSDKLKFLAGQNKILQDRRLVCYQITISFLPEITGHLSDKLKVSAG